ncbi:MAG: rhodanese-related sulfurtransferase [Prolixibacteraceae bacterium]|nr:rhodanese-related sulfurtransferase [Prolixibacteraceae bacterium]
MNLHNTVDRKILLKQLEEEPFERITVSFYRYFRIVGVQELRDALYREWNALNCFGRVYIAREGINAQMSIPEHHLEQFLNSFSKYELLKDIPVKYAIEDNGKSFYKLTLKIRPKLVADGLDEGVFDVTNVGTHLSATDFHRLSMDPATIVVDMRNHYESEIGHFKGAICPEADTFREEIKLVVDLLQDKKDKKILLYCTGGIRCEKASAYLKHEGFSDVNQLHGGILEYARHIRQKGLESNFIGKNFVFDQRLGERVSGDIISACHQCGKPCDDHINCANDLCHILFIQCPGCASVYHGCCSHECRGIHEGGKEKQIQHASAFKRKFGNRKAYRKSFLLVKAAHNLPIED